MQFTKVPFLANFTFASAYDPDAGKAKLGDREFALACEVFEGDICHLSLAHSELWTEDLNLVPLLPPEKCKVSRCFGWSKGGLIVSSTEGVPLLEFHEGFGVCGKQSMFSFKYCSSMRFYGMGEKTFGKLELSHKRSRFWNTDVLSDFHYKQWMDEPSDPYYVSIPYLIVHHLDKWVGLLYHNPFPTWMDTGSDPSFFGTEDENRRVILGSEDGLPSLWILVADSLAELTRKLQKLVGVTPRPPLWALGYHQCRWDYAGEKDLNWLSEGFDRHQVPCSGLWLDIDYMEGYRVFSVDKTHFPSGVKPALCNFADMGRPVVPILDPGVKLDPKYKVYQDGLKKGVFCLNPEGNHYVGFVWPGQTVFPDFSKPEGRSWWADYAADFLNQGFGGAWIDMNDPSTGAVDPTSMLFRDGCYPHGAFRNQYCIGMQWATREGFQKARPDERVFLLSRSGYTGTSRFSAIWTGDNVSNRFYLKGSIPTSMGLSLSGVPFNGPDVGGFIGDTNAALMIDWVKAGFLFPFFRNHSVKGSKRQEPWMLGTEVLRTYKHYVRLRYKLLPYLYQLFVANERVGDSILRPLSYEFPTAPMADDAFMVGPCILQAPCLEEGVNRMVKLPGQRRWFDARTGEWVKGTVEIQNSIDETGLFFRDGSAIPCQPGDCRENTLNLKCLEIHLFTDLEEVHEAISIDDGATLGYTRGEESVVLVQARRRGGRLEIETEWLKEGFGQAELTFVVYGEATSVKINGKRVAIRTHKFKWSGKHGISAKVCAHP